MIGNGLVWYGLDQVSSRKMDVIFFFFFREIGHILFKVLFFNGLKMILMILLIFQKGKLLTD